ncbi:hypothetical protein FQN54_004500 [Arachnomyces sp. PD_36]|nr:hypothetical protein FQN54_004500 [Arachnomyces sp. PD_36]
MSGVTHHVFRRGLDVASQHMAKPPGDGNGMKDPREVLPVWGLILLVLTVVTFAFAISAIGYTYGMVVATLTAVEDPEAEFYMPLETDGDDTKKGNGPVEPTLLLAKPKPITRKFRTTIKHLKDRAGCFSRFRGLRPFLVYCFCRDIVVSIFTSGSQYEPTVCSTLAQVAAEVALAQLGMAWVHIVISEPSSKAWFRRIPGLRSWAKIFPAALVASLGSRVTFFVPWMLASSLALTGNDQLASDPPVLATLGVFGLTLALVILIEVPATVTFFRVAASMLPEEDETIVPFDRTFGGKVTPAVLGGSGKIGLIDAWKSFNWASRIRFIMVNVKTAAMQVGVIFMMFVVLAAELVVMTGTTSPEKLRDLFGPSTDL